VFGQAYHWSLMQVEYATDLAFRSTTILGPLYDQLVRQSVLSVKARTGRHIPRPANHANACSGNRLAVLYPYPGDLHQASIWHVHD
jgi:hypothetical protein